MENQSTAHGAHAHWRTWRGCLRGQRATRSTPRCWPRIFFADTSPGRRRRLGNVVLGPFGSRAARPARASPRGEPADLPRSTRALTDLAWLSSRPTRDGLHLRAVGRGSTAPTPRYVGGGGWQTSWSACLTPVSRDPRALRSVENRPTAHGTRTCWQTWRGCLCCQRATRPTPSCWPSLFFNNISPGRRRRLCNLMVTVVDCGAARPAVASPHAHGEPINYPRSTRTLADLA